MEDEREDGINASRLGNVSFGVEALGNRRYKVELLGSAQLVDDPVENKKTTSRLSYRSDDGIIKKKTLHVVSPGS